MNRVFGPGIRPSSSAPVKNTWRGYGIVLAVALAFFGGWYVGQGRSLASGSADSPRVLNTGGSSQAENPDVDFNLFWQVWNDIKSTYVTQPVDETKLFYGAMRGMISALEDPYSDFFDPKTAAEFDAELSGSFSGIGVEIGKRNGTIVVIAPLADSPGEKAGLRPGDAILAIDSQDAIDMPLDQAVSLIRGEEGVPVELFVLPKGATEPKTITVVRQRIEHTGLRWTYRDDTAVLTFSGFDNDIDQLFNQFIRELETKPEVRGIVLDMRNNPGGYLEMAIEVASEWVEEGVIVRERDYAGNERQHQARGRARLAGYRTIVLVNEGSASASEIVAGALQDFGKAVIVGQTTFGKGSVQKYEPLEDGSAFKVTVAKWYTPDGRAIDEVGIAPDVTVELTEEDFNNDRDPQLDKAMELVANP